MIFVCRWASFTCCNDTCFSACNDGEIVFGHASLFCTQADFGVSGGRNRPLFLPPERGLGSAWGNFRSAEQKCFGKIVRYAFIPTVEDLPDLPGRTDDEDVSLITTTLSEAT